MFEVRLYKNLSENNKVDKDLDISQAFQGTLKENTDKFYYIKKF